MSYFSRFPVMLGYRFQDKAIDMMDLTRRTGFSSDVKNNSAYYIDHIISDGETPVILADRLYNDSGLYWVIMLFNDIFDIEADWPLDQVSLLRYAERVYENPYDIKHYESVSDGLVVDDDWPDYDRIGVRNIDYEIRLNDEKRYIKVPTPEAISQLVREHNRLIAQ